MKPAIALAAACLLLAPVASAEDPPFPAGRSEQTYDGMKYYLVMPRNYDPAKEEMAAEKKGALVYVYSTEEAEEAATRRVQNEIFFDPILRHYAGQVATVKANPPRHRRRSRPRRPSRPGTTADPIRRTKGGTGFTSRASSSTPTPASRSSARVRSEADAGRWETRTAAGPSFIIA